MPPKKQSRIQATLLLLEFTLRTLVTVWQVNSIVEWNRDWKTISLTVRNIKEKEGN